MRAALRLLPTSPTWPFRSRSSSLSYSKLFAPCRYLHASPRSATPSTWSLGELSRVSDDTGPFVFHLPSDNPYLNLSIEHYLLTKSHPESHILLFYTNRPCIVFGRNQNPWLEIHLKRAQDGLEPEELVSDLNRSIHARTGNQKTVPVDLVRRRSGGGTVFHDSGNLNYSVIVPNTKSFTRNKHAEMVVQGLQSLKSTTSAERLSSRDHRDDIPEVRVNERHDIVMRGRNEKEWYKVSGSAYKLTRGRALHHGTLLLSSPYIHKISDLLRSPGQGFITAMGVGSVRSKVGNLFQAGDASERDLIREDATKAIVRQFWNMYGTHQSREPERNEITLPSPTSLDELRAQNRDIANGVQELTSPSWIFEQTPRFEFQSGTLDNHEVNFHADKGLLKSISLSRPMSGSQANPGEVVWKEHQKTLGGAKTSDGKQIEADIVKLHELGDWSQLLSKVPDEDDQGKSSVSRKSASVPDALVKRLEAIFPVYATAERNDL